MSQMKVFPVYLTFESIFKRKQNIIVNAAKINHMLLQMEHGAAVILNLSFKTKLTQEGTMKVISVEVLVIALGII